MFLSNPVQFDQILENKISQLLQIHFGQEAFRFSFHETAPHFEKFKAQIKSRDIQIVTVAGTNGKGETSACLSQYLQDAGKKVGLWTSPHILTVRERFTFGQEIISYEKLLQLIQDELLTHSFLKNFSYFEFLFWIYLTWILRHEVEVIVLEVGLGGRLDAANFLEAKLVLLTSISRDHEAILGKGYAKILNEKLGVLRPQATLLANLELAYCRERTELYTKNIGANYVELFLIYPENYSKQNRFLAFVAKAWLLNQNIELEKLKAQFCTRNIEQIFKGRFERWHTTLGDYSFNGSHNLDGVRKLAFLLSTPKLKPFNKTIIAFSQRPSEEIEQMIKIFETNRNFFGKIYVTKFIHPKAYDGPLVAGQGTSYVADWREIFLQSDDRDKILVCGSYYFVGETQKFLSTFCRT
jgi:dihydrofolate synthase/folylpolyglutamate synthase